MLYKVYETNILVYEKSETYTLQAKVYSNQDHIPNQQFCHKTETYTLQPKVHYFTIHVNLYMLLHIQYILPIFTYRTCNVP